MTTKEWIMRFVACVALMAVAMGGCSYLNREAGLSDDWWGEELIEEALEQKTGLDLDLSPSSPE